MRKFEKCLLREIGYALILDRDSGSGEVIDASRKYFYIADSGPLECKQDKLSDIPWELVKSLQHHEKVSDDPDKLVEFVRLITKNNVSME